MAKITREWERRIHSANAAGEDAETAKAIADRVRAERADSSTGEDSTGGES